MSLEPYSITRQNDGYYEFVTDAGVTYACYFLSYSEYFAGYKDISKDIFGFNIDIISEKKTAVQDKRVGITVVNIVFQFLEKLRNAVLYVCDNVDQKELLRKRKFDSWFNLYDVGTIIKVDGHIEYEGINIYNAILVHKDNPKKNKYISAFIELNNPVK